MRSSRNRTTDRGRARYDDDAARNPVLLGRTAFELAQEANGDRGLGPVLAVRVDQGGPVAGSNPDVDTPADLARAIEASWVRASARTASRSIASARSRTARISTRRCVPLPCRPDATDDPLVAALLALVRPGDTWLDVGAGAGRFALPIARALDPSGGSVVALDVSPSMLEALDEIAEDHAIENVRTVELRWPPDGSARDFGADVGLIAHVGYDVEEIGPFLDALEAASRRLCVALLMERVPASAADPFWPPVHGEERVPPALPDAVELLTARGRNPTETRIPIEPRRFESREELEGFVRRQLWIAPDGPKERRFQAALDDLTEQTADGWTLKGRSASNVGVVTGGLARAAEWRSRRGLPRRCCRSISTRSASGSAATATAIPATPATPRR